MSQVLLKRGQTLCPKCGRPRYVIERCCDVYADPNAPEQTFWNYEPTPARKVRVIVGKALRPTFWHAGLEGTERAAVEVSYGGDKFYLDNEDGSGWNKVTCGRGGPDWGHSSLPDDSVPVNASADTHPKDGDVKQAPLVSGAVPKADAQPSGPILPNKERPR